MSQISATSSRRTPTTRPIAAAARFRSRPRTRGIYALKFQLSSGSSWQIHGSQIQVSPPSPRFGAHAIFACLYSFDPVRESNGNFTRNFATAAPPGELRTHTGRAGMPILTVEGVRGKLRALHSELQQSPRRGPRRTAMYGAGCR